MATEGLIKMGLGLTIIVYLVAVCALLAILGAIMRCGHPFKAVFLTALQGIAAIFAVKILGEFTGVGLPVNWYTLSVGCICGTPGVIMILMLNFIFT